jgi:hypothetical protein
MDVEETVDQPDPNTWPRTLTAAVDQILNRIGDKSKAVLRGTAEDELIRLHMTWGMAIRNEFGLWRGNVHLLESCGEAHPDGATSVIIRAVWQRLQSERPNRNGLAPPVLPE